MTTKNQMISKVRLFCSECMGAGYANTLELPINNPHDVETCSDAECIWFKFRMGRDPYPNPTKVAMGRSASKYLHTSWGGGDKP